MSTVCPSCGHRNADGAEFCQSCNAYLNWNPTIAEPLQAKAAPRAAPADPPTMSSGPLNLDALPRPGQPAPAANPVPPAGPDVYDHAPAAPAPPQPPPRQAAHHPAPARLDLPAVYEPPAPARTIPWLWIGLAAAVVMIAAAGVTYVLLFGLPWVQPPPDSAGRGTLAAGQATAVISDARITAKSKIFLTPNSTGPGNPQAKGLRVAQIQDGGMVVTTLDGQPTDVDQALPFDYLAINHEEGRLGAGRYVSGTAVLDAFTASADVPAPATAGDSAILLGVGVGPAPAAPLEISSRSPGVSFAVSTSGLQPHPAELRFHWLVVNRAGEGGGEFRIMMSASRVEPGQSTATLAIPQAASPWVLLTTDHSRQEGQEEQETGAHPGVFTIQAEDGKVVVSTMDRGPAPTPGAPFGWLVLWPRAEATPS
ncbi:zinc ribbon domain-containing protein [Nonomuraea polychroma]|uniref:zinc ribbon domain-containing protein n=1 Tax=Nonomuraea polychroma TaxID=46176 RepID=UPI003D930832